MQMYIEINSPKEANKYKFTSNLNNKDVLFGNCYPFTARVEVKNDKVVAIYGILRHGSESNYGTGEWSGGTILQKHITSGSFNKLCNL